LYQLQVDSNQLSGSLPPELGCLSNLRILQLGSNQLGGSIPPGLGDLSSLVWLYLNSNQLTGSIPSELGSLAGLQRLYLNSNQLNGAIPPELASLTSLDSSLTNIGYNALWTDDPTLQVFLDSKDPDWDQTQTITPADVATSLPTSSSAVLDWTPIPYVGDTGTYAVFPSPMPPRITIFTDGFESRDTKWWGLGNPWTTTLDKTDTSVLVDGLEPDTTYDFVIRTITEPHGNNQNQVVSDPSTTVTETTTQ